MKKLTFVGLCIGLLAAPLASAAILDFSTGTAGVGGTIVDLGSGDVRGFDIFIDHLVADGTSADGPYNVDGTLACASGAGGSCAALSFDTVAGTFSIVGSVSGLGVGATTLLSGTIDSFTFTNAGGIVAFFGTGTDTKDAGLLASVGIPPNTPFDFTGFTLGFSPVACGEGQTCYTAFSTDFVNSSGVGGEAVPGGTLVLLGGGLLGLFAAASVTTAVAVPPRGLEGSLRAAAASRSSGSWRQSSLSCQPDLLESNTVPTPPA
jgi:hypothetical protein